MHSSARHLGVAGLALLFACTVPAAPAFADPVPVTLIDGTYMGLNPPMSPVTGSSTITFTTPADAAFHPDQGVGGLAPHDLTMDLLNFISGETTVSVMFETPLVVSNGFGTATFNLGMGTLTIMNTQPSGPFMGTVTAPATYVSDTFGGAVNLSLFQLGGTGTFTANFTGIDVEPGTEPDGPFVTIPLAFWPAPSDAHPVANFMLEPAVLTLVPEPASLALWGLAGLAGVGWRCRRRWKVR
jgi:hypothetical protein